jgi:hypothetical protein
MTRRVKCAFVARRSPVTAEDLIEIELIKQVKYEYMRCVDQKCWGEIVECFTPTATAAYSGGPGLRLTASWWTTDGRSEIDV